MENLFRLSLYRLRSKTGKIRHPYNPTIRESIALYSTLDDAITTMREMVKTEENLFIYSFCIEEFEFKSWSARTATERCYTKDGQLYEQYLKSSNASFRGRDSKTIHFKEGDIVEVLQSGSISLERISYAPLSKEQYKERCENIRRCRGKASYVHYLDRSDDCYTTHSLIDLMDDFDGAHTHACPITVFPLSKPVSAKHRKAFIEKYTEYINGQNFYEGV